MGRIAQPPLTSEFERKRLNQLYLLDLLDTPRDVVFDRVVFTAAQLFRVPMSLISLVDQRRQWFKAQVGMGLTETPRDVSFCAHAILDQAVMVVEDARLDARFDDNPMVIGPPFIRFYAGAPLITLSGDRIGALAVLDRRIRRWTPQHAAQLQRLANGVVRLIEGRKAS